jgi:DNA repair exonuclease SbcCD ATPase subunit
MIEFTHATTRYIVKPENAQAIRAALAKPKKHKILALSTIKPKRSYPEFFSGMSTADYVNQFNKQFEGWQHIIKHDCANYYSPAPMLDASIPECVEDENPDYVYEPKKVKKSLAQQLAEADAKLDAADDELDRIGAACEGLRERLADVIAERDEHHEEAKTYRAALMALEAEVSPAMREFIREVLC